MPETADADLYYAALKAWVQRGGNLVVTDAAAPAMQDIGLLSHDEDVVRNDLRYVGSVEFATRDHELAQGLRGVARQTYDSVPIGFAFPPAGENCPNWSVATTAWEAAGGEVVGNLVGTGGTADTTRTTYGQAKYGEGMVRFIGALLPQPTEAFLHPYGLQNYAVTYTGYTLLQNSLNYDAPPSAAQHRHRSRNRHLPPSLRRHPSRVPSPPPACRPRSDCLRWRHSRRRGRPTAPGSVSVTEVRSGPGCRVGNAPRSGLG